MNNNSNFRPRFYRIALGFAVAFSFLHLISLPVAISYDGFIYLDMSHVLGSDRFPHDWNIARTPLYPLALKFACWLIGQQPLAVILVSTLLGLGGTIVLSQKLKKMLGPIPAGIVLIVLALFPLFVAFQHFALTEVGTAFFLIVLTVLLLWAPRPRRHIWMKAVGLMAVCATGYYWRQALLSLAPAAAVLHYVGSGRDFRNAESRTNRRWRTALLILAQVVLIAVLPFWLAKPWSKYVNEAGMRDVTLRQGMLRQALLPVEHPYVGINADIYRKAIGDSIYEGEFFSGLREDLLGTMSDKIYSKPMDKPVGAFFWDLIKQNPGSYLSGVGRTLVLFSGVKALQNENLISQEMILSPTLIDSKVGEGPPGLSWIQKDFQQKTKPCVVQNVLWTLAPSYGYLLIVANLITALGLLLGIIFRNKEVTILCAIPVTYMVACAIVLASIDRYAFPAYPIVLANAISVPVMVARIFRERISSRSMVPAGNVPAALTAFPSKKGKREA